MSWIKKAQEFYLNNPVHLQEEVESEIPTTTVVGDTLVDTIINSGETGPVEPEDKFGNPKQLSTIARLRKQGYDNSRIFDAMEIESSEAESLKNTMPDIKGQGKEFIGPPKRDRGTFAKFRERFSRARRNSKLDQLYYLSANEFPGAPPLDDVLEIIEEFEERSQYDPVEADNFLEDILLATGDVAGSLALGFEEGGKGAVAGATGAAAAGMTVAPMFAEEVFTVPAAAGLGFMTGSTIFWAQQGSGMVMRNLVERGVDPMTAGFVGTLAGIPYAFLERLQVTKLIPKSLQNKFNNKVSSEVAKYIPKLIAKYGPDYATQIVQEDLQLITTTIAEELTVAMQDADIPQKTIDQFLKELKETTFQTAKGFLLLQGGRAAVDVGIDKLSKPQDSKPQDIVAGLKESQKQIETQPLITKEEAITVESQAKQITDDEANDFNISYDRDVTGSRELSGDEILESGYDIDLNEIPISREDENGNKFYAVKVKGETDTEGNIRLTSAADRSTILEEAIEARFKKLQNSENAEDKALIDKIQIWMQSVRKKASEMGLEIRFSDTGEGNIELFSDAILYTIGGFKGLDKKFEDAIYVPEDISSEFVEKFGEMSDGTSVFELLKGSDKGIQANQEFATAVDAEIASQMELQAENIRPPPLKPTTKSKLSTQTESGSFQLEPDVINKAVGLYPPVTNTKAKADRLRLTVARREKTPLVGRQNNNRVEFELENGGVIILGRDKTPEDWIRQVESTLNEGEIRLAMNWYEDAYPAFVEEFGEADAVNYMVAWLLGNVQASPQQALSNTFLGMEQLKAELPSFKSAGTKSVAKNIKEVLQDQQTEKGAGAKLYDFLDSALGKPTRTVMQDDARGLAPVAIDRHTFRDAGFVDAAIKNILSNLAIDKDRVKRLRFDSKSSSPTDTQYEYALKYMNDLTDSLNDMGYMGGNLKPHQVQAIGWTAIARMSETSEGQSIPDALGLQKPTLAFELKFGKFSPYAAKYGDAFTELSRQEQIDLTSKATKSIVPELAKELGLKVNKVSVGGYGFWKDGAAPNGAINVRGSNQAIKGLMNSIGYLFQQEEVGRINRAPNLKGLGVTYSDDKLSDPDMQQALYKILREETDNDFTPGAVYEIVDGIPSLVVGTFIEQKDLNTYLPGLESAIERIRTELGIDLDSDGSIDFIGSSYEATKNNWKKNNSGERYRKAIQKTHKLSLQKRLDNYYGPQLDGIIESALAKKSEQQKRTRQLIPDPDFAAEVRSYEIKSQTALTEEDFQASVARLLHDRLGPVMRWQKDISEQQLGGARIRNSRDVLLASELFIGRVSERLKDFNKKMINHTNPDSFVSRLIAETGISLEEFGLYLHALHADERNIKTEKEDGSGLTKKQAAKIKADLNKKYGLSTLKRFVKEFQKEVIDGDVKIRYEAGLIDEATFNRFMDRKSEGNYKNYVPLFRVFDNQESVIDDAAKGVNKFSIRGKEYYKAVGSARKVRNPFIGALEQYHQAIVRSEKNLVNKRLLDLMESYPSDSYYIEGVPYQPNYNKDGEIDYYSEVSGRDKEGNPLNEKNTITVKVDGKVKRLIFMGKEGVAIASALNGLNNHSPGSGLKLLGKLNTYLRYVNTIANPEFIVTNFTRDIQSAGINIASEQGDAVLVQALSPTNLQRAWKAVYDLLQNDDLNNEWGDLYNRLRRAGGTTGFFDYTTLEEKVGNLEKDLNRVESTGRGIIDTGKSIFNFIENLNEATESAIRLSLFKAMLDQGYSEQEAASGAKNVTVNFNRKGEYGQLLNTLYLFANAGIQGSVRVLGVVKNSKRAQKIVAGLAAMGVMEAFYNRMASDDDEYDKQLNYEKDNYFIFRYGRDKEYFKMRLPYGYNVFKVMGNIAGDIAWKTMSQEAVQMDKEILRFLNACNNAFNPIGSGDLLLTLSPTFADPIIELSENKDFHGGPKMPTKPYGPDIADIQKSWEKTPNAYKDFAYFVYKATGGQIRYNPDGTIKSTKKGPGVLGIDGDISPETYQYIVEYMGGGLGKSVARLLNTTRDAVNYSAEWDKAPFIRQLYGEFKKDSGKQILYEFERNMAKELYTDAERLKYKKYLQDLKDNGQITPNEFEKRIIKFNKAQKLLMTDFY